MNRLHRGALAVPFAVVFLATAHPCFANPGEAAEAAAAQGAQTVQGVVISSTRSTLVIRTADGMYHIYALDSSTTRPEKVPVQSTVSVAARPAPAADQAATATEVRIVSPAPAPGTAKPAATDEAVPQSVRQMEDAIKRSTRRFHLGVRGGVALDPELVVVGVHSEFGPFFSRNFSARPSLELGFGEVTTLVALNLDGAYRLPVTPQTGKWEMYVGAGPGFNFTHLGFTNEETGDEEKFSFSDLQFDSGFNVVIGLQSRNGMMLELRSTAYSKPHLRFMLGFNF